MSTGGTEMGNQEGSLEKGIFLVKKWKMLEEKISSLPAVLGAA